MTEITLTGLTSLQTAIADFLWSVESDEDMDAVYAAFSRAEVEVVKSLMVLEFLDQEDGVDLARSALRDIGLL